MLLVRRGSRPHLMDAFAICPDLEGQTFLEAVGIGRRRLGRQGQFDVIFPENLVDDFHGFTHLGKADIRCQVIFCFPYFQRRHAVVQGALDVLGQQVFTLIGRQDGQSDQMLVAAADFRLAGNVAVDIFLHHTVQFRVGLFQSRRLVVHHAGILFLRRCGPAGSIGQTCCLYVRAGRDAQTADTQAE